jgi:hypothetical protein
MTKSAITRTWIVGLAALAVGLIVAAVSIGLMLGYGGTFTAKVDGNGYNFVPNFDSFFWTTVMVMIGGFFIAAVGGLVQLAAWIGALANTYRVPDKMWFVILLLSGLLSFAVPIIGFAVMAAYVIGGPDGMVFSPPRASVPAPRPSTLAPTS